MVIGWFATAVPFGCITATVKPLPVAFGVVVTTSALAGVVPTTAELTPGTDAKGTVCVVT